MNNTFKILIIKINIQKKTMSIKILVADDSSFMRKMIVSILNETGYTDIIEVENGKEALEKFAAEKPDVALLDIIMPEVGGIDVLKQIGKKAKVIMVSAVGQEGVIEEAKSFGAKGFIVKPFDNEKAKAEIKKVIG